MGMVPGVGADAYPEQFRHNVGLKVLVIFGYDSSKRFPGTVIRDDATEPYQTIILLDDGRVVRGQECQWSPEGPGVRKSDPGRRLEIAAKDGRLSVRDIPG